MAGTVEHKSLREKVMEGMSNEEICDVLLSLMNRALRGETVGSEPENIILDTDNLIINILEPDDLNLLMMPPEVIRAAVQGRSFPRDKDQHWFFLGMLAYYMYYKTDYYLQNNLDRYSNISGTACMIQENRADRIPFRQAVCRMTAANPQERRQGLALFLQYLAENLTSSAVVQFFCDGRMVGTKNMLMRRDVENLLPSGSVCFQNVVYRPRISPVCILYRPGRHTYHIEVTRINERI